MYMKFLVTGGLGFIGSNFILQIFEKYPKSKIINIDLKQIGSNIKNLENLKNNNNYLFVKGDINNKILMEKLIKKSDIIINFAAETHVDRSIKNSYPFLKSNLLGVQVILELITKYKKRLIQISTDEVFGSIKNGMADENFAMKPSNPYSVSKASAELLVESYINTFDCDVNITRCTNNYGPRQSPEKLIPKVILLAKQNKKIPVYGTGKNIRDWIFVKDHCEAITDVIFKGKRDESYNISSFNELDNLTIIKKILKLMDKSNKLIEHIDDRPGHDFRYSLDSKKIRKLKWKPKYDLKKGLSETIQWYLSNEKWVEKFPKEIWKNFWTEKRRLK